MARFLRASRRCLPALNSRERSLISSLTWGHPQFHFLANAVDGSIKPHTGLCAYDHQVKGIGKTADDLVLPSSYLDPQPEIWEYKTL